MKVLIFGVSGFIGAHLAKFLTEKGYEVYGVCRSWNPHGVFVKMGVHTDVAVMRGDILNSHFVNEVVNYVQPDVVFHLAAQSDVRKAIKDPITTHNINVIGTAKVLEACLKNHVGHVIVYTSDKVYGNRVNAKETDPLSPVEPYGMSKVAQDYLCQSYMDRIPITIIRMANGYGYDHNKRIVPNVIRQCLRGETPKIFKETKDNLRQYIYIKDVCRALELIVDRHATGIFNLGTNDVLTQEEVVKTICSFFNVKPEYVSVPEMYTMEISRQSVDWSKIRALGFKPIYSFEEGIKDTIDYFGRYGL